MLKMMTNKKRWLLVIGVILLTALNVPAVAQAASDGSLSVNTQTIYDDGRSNNGAKRDYGVKTLWAGERDQKNQTEMKRANQVGKRADQVAFTNHESNDAVITKHNNQVLKTYVFGGKYTAPIIYTAADQSQSWWDRYHQAVYIGILMMISLIVGGWLGRQFASYKQTGGFTWQHRV